MTPTERQAAKQHILYLVRQECAQRVNNLALAEMATERGHFGAEELADYQADAHFGVVLAQVARELLA